MTDKESLALKIEGTWIKIAKACRDGNRNNYILLAQDYSNLCSLYFTLTGEEYAPKED